MLLTSPALAGNYIINVEIFAILRHIISNNDVYTCFPRHPNFNAELKVLAQFTAHHFLADYFPLIRSKHYCTATLLPLMPIFNS